MSRLIYADQLTDLETLRDEVDELREKQKRLEEYIEDLEEFILDAEGDIPAGNKYHDNLAALKKLYPKDLR